MNLFLQVFEKHLMETRQINWRLIIFKQITPISKHISYITNIVWLGKNIDHNKTEWDKKQPEFHISTFITTEICAIVYKFLLEVDGITFCKQKTKFRTNKNVF